MSFLKKLFNKNDKGTESNSPVKPAQEEVVQELEDDKENSWAVQREEQPASTENIREEINEDKEEDKDRLEDSDANFNSAENLESKEIAEASNEEDSNNREVKKESFVKKLFAGLSKTRDSILKGVDEVLSAFKHIDEDLYEELEEVLIMADFGMETTMFIMEQLRHTVKQNKLSDPSQLKEALQGIITQLLSHESPDETCDIKSPTVILVIGVNGAGKTTSIGKLAYLFKQSHKKVLLAAADTFRAAAIDQLQIWANRANVELIKHEEGSDAAAVVFDAISAAKSRKSDVLICDTAGRLQNKTNLMKELEKISRIIEREYPEAKKEILIVLDATTGQNALQQVKLFKEVADISGIILTKLDGTAKGGAVVGIYSALKVPVKYIGVGETIEDLQPFDPKAFAKALFKEN